MTDTDHEQEAAIRAAMGFEPFPDAVPDDPSTPRIFPQALIDLARAEHSHKGLGHPQEGNPFYQWSRDCQFRCAACLLGMIAAGKDVALAFTQALPWDIDRTESWKGWWGQTAGVVISLCRDVRDHEWVQEQLNEAIRRGNERDRHRRTGR